MVCLSICLSYQTVSNLKVETTCGPLLYPWRQELPVAYYQSFRKCWLDSGSQWERGNDKANDKCHMAISAAAMRVMGGQVT